MVMVPALSIIDSLIDGSESITKKGAKLTLKALQFLILRVPKLFSWGALGITHFMANKGWISNKNKAIHTGSYLSGLVLGGGVS